MKKLRKLLVVLLGIFMVLLLKKVNAATSATVFTGTSIEIEKIESIEIISNDMNIDLEKSEVSNDYLIKNTENSELVTKITAKLEDEQSSFSIKDLSIKVNELEIKNIQKEKDNYIFYVRIEPNSYKKIEFNYTTENDLTNAKVIKYSLDSFKDKKIKKFNIDIKIPEVDVPLVKKIYPECFEYDKDENDINVQYYDFTVNNLTKDFIIEKETYKNLIYGGEADKGEFDEAVYKNAKDMILNGVDNNFSKYIKSHDTYDGEKLTTFDKNSYFSNLLEKKMTYDDYESDGRYIEIPDTMYSIIEYILFKQIQKDGITKVKGGSIFVYEGDYPLTKDLFQKYNFSKLDGNLYGKKVCVDYVESEGDKDLYMGTRGWTATQEPYYGKFSEFDLLRKRNTGDGERFIGYIYNGDKNYSYRTINVGLDISGNKMDVSEEEIVDYVNMIEADLYIRKVIYDGNVMIKKTYDGKDYDVQLSRVVAYYNDENKVTASKYLGDGELSKLIKFENEIVSNNSRVPTVVSCVGYRSTIDGKYVVNYFNGYNDNLDGLGNIYDAINTNSAKELIDSNNEENEKIKDEVEEEIKSSKVIVDTEEFDVNKKESVIDDTPVEEVFEHVEKKFSISRNEIIIISVLGIAILINIIVIIKNRRRSKNGR